MVAPHGGLLRLGGGGGGGGGGGDSAPCGVGSLAAVTSAVTQTPPRPARSYYAAASPGAGGGAAGQTAPSSPSFSTRSASPNASPTHKPHSWTRCPACGGKDVRFDVCDNCGSIEGYPVEDDDANKTETWPSLLKKREPTKMFSYDWAGGALCPFVRTQNEALTKALDAADEAADASWPCTKRGGLARLLSDASDEGRRKHLRGEFVDIGSGDGTVLFEAARRYEMSRVVGIEYDEELVRATERKAVELALSHRVIVVQGDLANPSDLERVLTERSAVVYLYLLPTALKETKPLKEALVRVLRRGGIVISMTWRVEGWDNLRRNAEDDGFHIYKLQRVSGLPFA